MLAGSTTKQKCDTKSIVGEALTDIDIQKTLCLYCCKGRCLATMTYSQLCEVRRNLYKLNNKDRMSSLQWMVKKKEDTEQWAFIFGTQTICKTAFKMIFKVSNTKVDRLQRLHDVDPRAERAGKPIGSTTMDVLIWLQDFFTNNGQQQPNKDYILLPDNYSKEEVWKRCKGGLGFSGKKSVRSYKYFTKLWRQHFPNIQIPAINRFSTCGDCAKFKAKRDKGQTKEERSKYELFHTLISHFPSWTESRTIQYIFQGVLEGTALVIYSRPCRRSFRDSLKVCLIPSLGTLQMRFQGVLEELFMSCTIDCRNALLGSP